MRGENPGSQKHHGTGMSTVHLIKWRYPWISETESIHNYLIYQDNLSAAQFLVTSIFSSESHEILIQKDPKFLSDILDQKNEIIGSR